jgi:hypothetical protein
LLSTLAKEARGNIFSSFSGEFIMFLPLTLLGEKTFYRIFFFLPSSMGQQLSSTTNNTQQATTSDIHWVPLQDPGNTTHVRYPAKSRDETHKRLMAAYQNEMRTDREDDESDARTEPAPPSTIHFYQGNEKEDGELYPATHGFYQACHNAWAYHASLVLSPDDVWLAIQAVFAGYMRVNAETLRTTFVSHEGKKELIVYMDDAPEDWKLFMTRVVEKITANSKIDMAATFVPSFTSSDAFDTSMKSLAVLDHMQLFFEYVYSFQCGVRRVGLKGNLADWELLRAYIEGLRAFAVPADKKDAYFTDATRTYTSWIDDLVRIADQLVATYKGTPDVIWWNSMIHERQTYGSGGSTYIKGWIIALLSANPTDQEMEVCDIKGMRFSVPVKHDYYGKITRMRVLGGFTGTLYDATLDSWSPQRSMTVLDDFAAIVDK